MGWRCRNRGAWAFSARYGCASTSGSRYSSSPDRSRPAATHPALHHRPARPPHAGAAARRAANRRVPAHRLPRHPDGDPSYPGLLDAKATQASRPSSLILGDQLATVTFHRLTVTGPVAILAAFRAAASGAGTIPWRLDLDSLEENWFHLLVKPAHRALSVAARVLAGQLREAVEHRHPAGVARVGQRQACPFDLHALVPVSGATLILGPDHPDALAWLWQHWGTTQALRHVALHTALMRAAILDRTVGELLEPCSGPTISRKPKRRCWYGRCLLGAHPSAGPIPARRAPRSTPNWSDGGSRSSGVIGRRRITK